MPGAAASASLAILSTQIDHATQHGKQFRHPLHFVKNNEPVAVSEQKRFRIVQLT